MGGFGLAPRCPVSVQYRQTELTNPRHGWRQTLSLCPPDHSEALYIDHNHARGVFGRDEIGRIYWLFTGIYFEKRTDYGGKT